MRRGPPTTRSPTADTEQRQPDGTFGPCNPGKPRGACNRATRAVKALLDGEAEALTRKVVEQALGGDTVAKRLCLERIAPRRTDAPVTVDLPPLRTAESAVQAAAALVRAVSQGKLTPTKGAQVTALVEGFRCTLELADGERRLRELEEAARAPVGCSPPSPRGAAAGPLRDGMER